MKKKLRYALFDLDNTLYPKSCGLMQEIGRRINLYMVERLGMHPDEVGARRDALWKTHGTTLNALRRYYSVDPDEFLDFVHDIPLEGYLRYEAALDQMLGTMQLQPIIFTNADAKHARRVLSRLGILRHFESIVDIHLLEFVNKPDRRAYLKVLDFVSARPEECVLLEDTMVNIKPAMALGMTTVMVGKKSHADGAHYQIEHVTEFANLLDLL